MNCAALSACGTASCQPALLMSISTTGAGSRRASTASMSRLPSLPRITRPGNFAAAGDHAPAASADSSGVNSERVATGGQPAAGEPGRARQVVAPRGGQGLAQGMGCPGEFQIADRAEVAGFLRDRPGDVRVELFQAFCRDPVLQDVTPTCLLHGIPAEILAADVEPGDIPHALAGDIPFRVIFVAYKLLS